MDSIWATAHIEVCAQIYSALALARLEQMIAFGAYAHVTVKDYEKAYSEGFAI